MAAGQLRIVGAQPLATDRESTEALGFFDSRLLQQRQRAAAGSDEHEFASQCDLLAGATVGDLDRPATVGLLVQMAYLVAEQGVHSAGGAEAEQLFGQRSEVDVGTVLGPVQPDRIGEVAAGRHQRQPARELVDPVDELHRGEQRVAHQGVAAAPQIVDALGALDETDVWDRVEEAANVGEDSVLMGVGPELAGHLELLVDIDRLGDLDGAVGLLRGVVQFA